MSPANKKTSVFRLALVIHGARQRFEVTDGDVGTDGHERLALEEVNRGGALNQHLR